MFIVKRPILTEEKVNDLRSRFTLESLELGFGYTLGSLLCRTLLSLIPDAAMMSAHVDGVLHGLRTIEGAKEDVAEIILNIERIVLSNENDEPVVIYLRGAGLGETLAGDITPPTGVEIRNPDLHLATPDEKGELEIEPVVERGRGYVSAAQGKDPQAEVSRIPIDSIYSLVVEMACKVEATRVQQRTDSNRLVVDMETKPVITPRGTLASADKIPVELFGLMRELNEEAEDIEVGPSTTDATLATDLALSIGNLNLQSRSYNTLCHRGILTVDELVAHSEADLLNIRNFGTKPIEEVKEPLVALDMMLKSSVMPNFGDSKSTTIFSGNQPT